MKQTFYTTIENQLRSDGSYGLLFDHFTDKNAAYAKFFTICAAAAVSEIPYHAAYLIDSQFGAVKEEKWIRDLNPPES